VRLWYGIYCAACAGSCAGSWRIQARPHTVASCNAESTKHDLWCGAVVSCPCEAVLENRPKPRARRRLLGTRLQKARAAVGGERWDRSKESGGGRAEKHAGSQECIEIERERGIAAGRGEGRLVSAARRRGGVRRYNREWERPLSQRC
jgi:hypothetical protein